MSSIDLLQVLFQVGDACGWMDGGHSPTTQVLMDWPMFCLARYRTVVNTLASVTPATSRAPHVEVLRFAVRTLLASGTAPLVNGPVFTLAFVRAIRQYLAPFALPSTATFGECKCAFTKRALQTLHNLLRNM